MRNFLLKANAKSNVLKISLGLEAIADGQKRQELEYTFYGKLDDLSVLETDKVNSKEGHEQYFIPLESDHIGMRIRRINLTNFVMTVKARRDGVKGKEEVEQDITEDMFNLLRETATSGYKKTRYVIPVEGTDLKWEVDVFKDAVEQVNNWIKLDLEVPEVDTPLPELPFSLSESIVAQGDRKTDEEVTVIDRLWQKDWNILADNPPVSSPEDNSVTTEATLVTDDQQATPVEEAEGRSDEPTDDPSLANT